MPKPYNKITLTQDELKALITYDSDKGILYTKYDDVINQGTAITFNFKGKLYRLKDVCYVYMKGPIPDGMRVCLLDKNRNNLKFDNLYLD